MGNEIMTDEGGPVTGQPVNRGGAGVSRGLVTGVFVAGFVFLIGYRHGGYELPMTGEATLLVSWLVLIGAILGVIPTVRLTGARAAAVGLLSAFLAWELISVLWSDAAGRTVSVGVQLAAVLSCLLAAALVVRREDSEAVLGGLLAGVALIAFVAVGSRLHPTWFPDTVPAGDLARMRPRLHWPIGYWNASAYLMAMALPLAVHFATGARKGLSRALAGASIPLLSLCILFAISRGGSVVALFAVLVGFLLGPINARRIAGLAIAAVASGVVVATALSGQQLMDGLTDSGAGADQARLTLLVLLATALAVATVTVALHHLPGDEETVDRGRARPWLRLSVVLGLVAVGAGLFFASGGGPQLNKSWNAFRNPHMTASRGSVNSVERLASQSSNGRWQLWTGAVNAGAEHPLTGTGGGTFELWWNKHRTSALTVKNVHSLYLEAWSDLGLIGLLLMLGFFGAMLWGCASALRRAGPQLGLAGAGTATVAAFALSSATDWGWQVTILPIVAVVAFAAVATPDVADELQDEAQPKVRFGIGLFAVLLLVLVVPPTVASHGVIQSRQEAAKKNFAGAVAQARSARNWQPYSSEAWLQEGLAQEAGGNYAAAKPLVLGAIKREPGAWQPWLVLAGIEARAGNEKAALRDYRRSRDLNPMSRLFEAGN
ncbi:MAG: O-antigen ligase family protein [Solirubrobacterales bacterium]|nr:O-antigen ligase family protein [Solirubrobacterales bacterium]